MVMTSQYRHIPVTKPMHYRVGVNSYMLMMKQLRLCISIRKYKSCTIINTRVCMLKGELCIEQLTGVQSMGHFSCIWLI